MVLFLSVEEGDVFVFLVNPSRLAGLCAKSSSALGRVACAFSDPGAHWHSLDPPPHLLDPGSRGCG